MSIRQLLLCVPKFLLSKKQTHRDVALANSTGFVLNGSPFRFLDIGASGGILPRFLPYRSGIAFTGLEPDERSVKALLESPFSKEFASYKVHPSAAWENSGRLKIHFTRKPTCSSVFEPNIDFLGRFPDVERFDVVGEGEMECQTLDRLLVDPSTTPDFIKLDLEGGELAVLNGAPETLKTCLGLHTEVSFHQLRRGQPRFGDISSHLHDQGFEFIDFVTISRWSRDKYDGVGQVWFGDALFMRSPEYVANEIKNGLLEPRKANSYVWLCLIYARYDLALRFLEQADGLLSEGLIAQSRLLISVRRKKFDRRNGILRIMTGLYNYLLQSDTDLHLLY